MDETTTIFTLWDLSRVESTQTLPIPWEAERSISISVSDRPLVQGETDTGSKKSIAKNTIGSMAKRSGKRNGNYSK